MRTCNSFHIALITSSETGVISCIARRGSIRDPNFHGRKIEGTNWMGTPIMMRLCYREGSEHCPGKVKGHGSFAWKGGEVEKTGCQSNEDRHNIGDFLVGKISQHASSDWADLSEAVVDHLQPTICWTTYQVLTQIPYFDY